MSRYNCPLICTVLEASWMLQEAVWRNYSGSWYGFAYIPDKAKPNSTAQLEAAWTLLKPPLMGPQVGQEAQTPPILAWLLSTYC